MTELQVSLAMKTGGIVACLPCRLHDEELGQFFQRYKKVGEGGRCMQFLATFDNFMVIVRSL